MTTMNKWTPTTNLLELRRLGKTCEELGELVAVLGRTICQGLDGVDPASGESNIQRITKESADVIAQIGCNVEAFKLDQAAIDQRTADKSRQMGEWEALFGQEPAFIQSVRALCVAGRTTGGTAGRDDGLCAALDQVEAALQRLDADEAHA